MNTLSIDIGNSKIKLSYWANDGILFRSEHDTLPMDEIRERVDNICLKGIIVSSVRSDNESVIREIREKSGCDIVVDFNHEEIEKLSDKINYKGTIGSDRIAAFLGAEAIFSKRAMLIVDAGTAITLDIADKYGHYCGGNISLGLYSRMKALADATSLLPQINGIAFKSYFGDDTATAIKSGAINGVTGEILYTIELAKREYEIEWVVITGGDAGWFERSIVYHWENCFYDIDLVGRGLNFHLRKYYFPEEFFHTQFIPAI